MPPKCTIQCWFSASTADSRTSRTVRTSENCSIEYTVLNGRYELPKCVHTDFSVHRIQRATGCDITT